MTRRCIIVSAAVLVACSGVVAMPATATVSGENGSIAFVTFRDGNYEIYIMNRDGSDQVNLTEHPAEDYDPAWSPDGRQIAFVSHRLGEPAIFVMDGDGANQRFLVAGRNPAWSPDGEMIAYAAARAVPDGRQPTEIYLVDINTRVSTRLTDASNDPGWAPPFELTVVHEQPAFSPDGSAIAYSRYLFGDTTPTQEDGSRQIQIAQLSDPDDWVVGHASGEPDWAPEGASIIVASFSYLAHSGSVVTVDPVSGAATLVPIAWPGEVPVEAAWSPDGDVMVVHTIPVSRTYPGFARIRMVDRDGSDLITLTGSGSSPAWQPLNPYPIGLVDPATGRWHLRHVDATVTSFYFGNPGDLPFMGDWNCDGIDTPGLYRQSDGFVYLRNSNTQGAADIRFFFGNPGDVPLAGDFDGDGCDTVSLYRPSESRVFIIDELGSGGAGLGAATTAYSFGNPGDSPFIGDFDGDGIDTVALHRPSTGLVYYRDSHTQGIADHQFVFGNPGDRIVAADWDHDGIDSPALFRPSNTTNYFRFTNAAGSADARYIWGEAHWLPVAGSFGP